MSHYGSLEPSLWNCFDVDYLSSPSNRSFMRWFVLFLHSVALALDLIGTFRLILTDYASVWVSLHTAEVRLISLLNGTFESSEQWSLGGLFDDPTWWRWSSLEGSVIDVEMYLWGIHTTTAVAFNQQLTYTLSNQRCVWLIVFDSLCLICGALIEDGHQRKNLLCVRGAVIWSCHWSAGKTACWKKGGWPYWQR